MTEQVINYDELKQRSRLQTNILNIIDRGQDFLYSFDIARELNVDVTLVTKELDELLRAGIVEARSGWKRKPDDLSMKVPYKQSWLVQEALEKAYQMELLHCEQEGIRLGTFPTQSAYLRKLRVARDIIAAHIQRSEEMGG